jgi:hypothetical protein
MQDRSTPFFFYKGLQMAIKKAQPLQESEVFEPEAIQEFINADSLNPALESLYAELNIVGDADATVHVSKLDADGKGNDANVWKGDPDSYDLETLVKKFGSGTYRVMVYVKMPSGKKVRQVNKTIAWLLSPEDESKRQAALIQPQAQTGQQLPQPDFMAAIRELAGSFQNTILQVINAQKSTEKDPLQTLEGIERLAKVMIPAQTPQPDTFKSTMQMLDTLLTLRDKITPAPKLTDEDGDISMPAVAMAAIREFRNMRQTPQENPAQSVPAIAAPVAPVDPQIALQQQETEDMNILLNAQLRMANRAAAGNVDPAEYAESIYGIIPDDIIQLIGGNSDWFAELVKIAPACEQYKQWYLLLGAKIKAMAIEDNLLTIAPAPVQTPANGDTNGGASSAI